MILDNSGLVIGGGTNAPDKFGEPVPFSEADINFYDFVNNRWISSTDNSSRLHSRPVTPLQVGRMNHACIKYSDVGRTKVMVAGGVTSSEVHEFRVVRTVEVLDVTSLSWRRTDSHLQHLA